MPGPRLHINHKLICGALLAVALIPVVVAVTATVRHWAPLPYWDEWFTPAKVLISYAQGTLNFSDFFLQHNESRKIFPRLLYLALAKLHGWDVRDGMVVTLLEVATLCTLCFLLFLRTKGATAAAACAAFTLTTYLSFSPIQYQNFLWGLQCEPFLPGLAVVLIALVNLSRLRFGAKTLINLSLALVATYTFANGMLLWLLGIPLSLELKPDSKTNRATWYSIYAFVGVAAIALYFVGYKGPVEHPGFHFDVIQIIHYIILWTGGYYNSKDAWPFAIGGIVLALWLSASANAILLIKRGADWRHFYPWLLVSAYALASSVITAIGRSGFGVEQALSNRYTTFSLFLYLGLVGITFTLYCYYQDRDRFGKRLVVGVTVGAVALSIPAWRFCLHDNKQVLVQTAERNARSLCALAWINVLPGNPDLKLIFPYPDVLHSRANILAKAKLLRLHLVSSRLLDQMKEPAPPADAPHGQLEQATVREKSLVASGWAWRPTVGPKPDCVLVVLRSSNGEFRPLLVTPLHGPRPDVDAHRKKARPALAFYSAIPISIPLNGSIEAWAIDSAAEIAWPLGGRRLLLNSGRTELQRSASPCGEKSALRDGGQGRRYGESITLPIQFPVIPMPPRRFVPNKLETK